MALGSVQFLANAEMAPSGEDFPPLNLNSSEPFLKKPFKDLIHLAQEAFVPYYVFASVTYFDPPTLNLDSAYSSDDHEQESHVRCELWEASVWRNNPTQEDRTSTEHKVLYLALPLFYGTIKIPEEDLLANPTVSFPPMYLEGNLPLAFTAINYHLVGQDEGHKVLHKVQSAIGKQCFSQVMQVLQTDDATYLAGEGESWLTCAVHHYSSIKV